jgi:DNA-directed RNA polymerase specialized sigma24 family protein
LEAESPDGAAVVRLRFFAGLSVEQTAHVLGLSASTVDRRWAFARAWLFQRLGKQT